MNHEKLQYQRETNPGALGSAGCNLRAAEKFFCYYDDALRHPDPHKRHETLNKNAWKARDLRHYFPQLRDNDIDQTF